MKAINHLLPILFIVMLQGNNTQAQTHPQPLKTGERLPNALIRNVIGQGSKPLDPADLYRDGLLLIDFWFTSCVPCIREMRMFDSLKTAHPKKFNVLMVTYQDSTEIKNFFKRDSNRGINTANLYFSTNDTVLKKLFPHKVAPHNVWVDKTGTVRAITGTEEVTAEKILAFDRNPILKNKADNFRFNPLNEFHEGDSSYHYRSIITPYIKGVERGTIVTTGNKKTGFSRFSGYNLPLINIYWQAYSGFVTGPRMQLIEVEKQDSLEIVNKRLDEQFWYNYSLTLEKPVPAETMRDYIFQDLSRQFGVSAQIRINKTTCMVVTKKGGEKLPAVSSPQAPPLVKKEGKVLRIRNARISDVTSYLFNAFGRLQVPYPYVIEIKKKDDVPFDADLDFSPLLSPEKPGIGAAMYYDLLSKYGFRFAEGLRDYPILMLQKTGNKH